MNRLQGIPSPGEMGSPGCVLVTMNPTSMPQGQKGTYVYDHPLFTSSSCLATRNLHLINGVSRISFAGAWMGYGFHEDGFVAGLNAARSVIDGPRVDQHPPERSKTEYAPLQDNLGLGERIYELGLETIQSLNDICSN